MSSNDRSFRAGQALAQITARSLQDALTQQTREYWLKRAEAFEWAKPNLDDYRGQAVPTQLSEAWRRCDLAAKLCRHRASLEEPGQPIDPMVLDVMLERVGGDPGWRLHTEYVPRWTVVANDDQHRQSAAIDKAA